MIDNLINALYYSFIFYIGYSVLYRVIEIKKYVKKSNKDGTYNESYKIMYSKHLKSNCIVTSTIMGIFNFADNIDKRYDIDNGICLCEKCHRNFHNMLYF